MSGKRNVARTLTLLIFFVLIVVIILVIFAYFSGLFGLIPSTGQKNVAVTGVFSADNGGGTGGTLIISITNFSTTPIVGATFSCPPAQFSDPTCGGLALQYNGVPVSSSNTITYKETGSAGSSVTSASGTTFSAGDSYTVTVTVRFADGTTQSYPELLVAQA